MMQKSLQLITTLFLCVPIIMNADDITISIHNNGTVNAGIIINGRKFVNDMKVEPYLVAMIPSGQTMPVTFIQGVYPIIIQYQIIDPNNSASSEQWLTIDDLSSTSVMELN